MFRQLIPIGISACMHQCILNISTEIYNNNSLPLIRLMNVKAKNMWTEEMVFVSTVVSIAAVDNVLL